MKKLFTFILGLGMVAGANAQNPFAYGLSTDGNVVSPSEGVLTVKVNYSLNADAESVNALIKNAEGEVVKTLPLSGIAKGTYENVELDLVGIGHGDFTWAIEVEGKEVSAATKFNDGLRFYHPRGIDVDNNTESPNFGNIYVTEGMTSSSATYYPATRGGVGLFIFDPQMNGIKNEVTGKYAFMGGLTYSFISYAADLCRVRVAKDGRIFVTRCNNAGDYILYAPSQEDLVKNDKFTSLLAGGELDATTYNYNTTNGFLAGPNLGFDLKGSDENLKLLALSVCNKQFAASNTTGSIVNEYSLGTAEVLPTPTQIDGVSNYTIISQSSNVTYDNRGGVWYCQYRGTPTDSQPALIYVDANGEQKYFEGTGGKVRGGGGIRFNPDFTQIAIATSKTQFTIYDIEYAEDNTPKLTEVEVVTHGIGTNVYDLAWDLANNIYICGNSGEWFRAFALPRANNVFATPAASKYTLKIDSATAVGEINTDANAPVEYYNLQGVKVENPAGGIFIRKQGSKTTKVVL